MGEWGEWAPHLRRSTHVDLVLLVADFEVGVDPVLVNLADHGHVGDAVLRRRPCEERAEHTVL